MPHGKRCPHCKKKVWDWYIEWYDPAITGKEIFNSREAMDCPWCRKPVLYDRIHKTIPAAPDGKVPHVRDIQLATKTAMRRGYPTLEDFWVAPLERKTAAPFRFRYWPNIYLPIRRQTP